MTVRIAVIGSVNLDIVARCAHLPAPGETVTGASLARYPGGKGANQALAARRLGADVALVARVGGDAAADEALALLKADGVHLSGVGVDETLATGVALIAVSEAGENQIVVAPGANAALAFAGLPPHDALVAQLEVPVATVLAAAQASQGLVVLNLAPAVDVPDALLARAGVIVVNEGEAAHYGSRLDAMPARIARTHGASGAALFQGGREIARAAPPPIRAVDTTGAGDCFVAALTVALAEGRGEDLALTFAVRAAALACTRQGAQPALPWRAEL